MRVEQGVHVRVERGIHGTALSALAQTLGADLPEGAHLRVAGIHHDSRRVEPGDVFVALAGRQFDGLSFLSQALGRGARALVVEAGRAPVGLDVPVLEVADARVALSRGASLLYGHPSRHLTVVGITGTNGKTTTAELVRAALEAAGSRPAVMGTLGARFAGRVVDSPHGNAFNTPEGDELARIGAWLCEQGASHLVMEVTSHALAERRVDGTDFSVAAFSNLTRDHLDLHPSMEAYGQAKARLFLDLDPGASVLSIDDPLGARLAERVGSAMRVSCEPTSRADVRPLSEPRIGAAGIACTVATPAGDVRIESPLLGRHNLANLLLSLGIALALGLDPDRAATALCRCPPVVGRLERCEDPGDDVQIFVDYAHTPDALEQVLTTLRPLSAGRLVCVFGCGGERDVDKRPLMGEVVARLADRAVVTSDNPRREDPRAIADGIQAGMQGGRAEVVTELDRRRAIEGAVQRLEAGDLLVVAGKGHEREQVVGDRSRAFDDCEVVRGALARRRREGGKAGPR